jgi:hypothetical protein
MNTANKKEAKMRNRNPNLKKPTLGLRGRTTPADMAELIRRAEKAVVTFVQKPAADPPQPTPDEAPPWI